MGLRWVDKSGTTKVRISLTRLFQLICLFYIAKAIITESISKDIIILIMGVFCIYAMISKIDRYLDIIEDKEYAARIH